MLTITSEEDNYTIHHYKFTEVISNEDMTIYKNHILNEFNNNKKFYAIQDVLEVNNFKLNYMKHFLILDNLFKDKTLVKKYVGATVIVVNKKSKGMFDLIFKFRKTVTPNKIVTSLEEAVQFIFTL
jgi:hypothetical protein